MKNQTKGIALAIIGPCLWGLIGLFVRKLTAAGLSGSEIAFMRCTIAAIGYISFLAVKSPSKLRVDAKGLVVCVIYGILGFSCSFLVYTVAVSRIPLAVATVLMFMSPIWVALISKVVFKDALGKRKLLAIAICILGACLAANLVGSKSIGALDFIGILGALANGMCVALQLLIPRYFSDRYHKDTMLAYGFLGAALFLAIFVDPSSVIACFKNNNTLEVVINVLSVSIFCTLIASTAVIKSASYIGATTTSILSALEVVMGSIMGWLVFREHITALQFVGCAVIAFGVIYAQRGLKNKNKEAA